jgi:Stage II sporulation protein E (SpoIIE)
LPRGQQCLLQDVLGVLQGSEHPVAVHLWLSTVWLGQLSERLAVPRPGPGDQVGCQHSSLASFSRSLQYRHRPNRELGLPTVAPSAKVGEEGPCSELDTRGSPPSSHLRAFAWNTEPDRYATLFVAHYDAVHRRLSYVNCGHNPPLLVHSNGDVELLKPTATVLGLFSHWDCTVAEVRLGSGDALVMYTDGVTEAENGNGEEFGVQRLLDVLRSNAGVPTSVLLNRAVSAVESFRAGEQEDDMTLVIAMSRK